jgi:hypothetical protein
MSLIEVDVGQTLWIVSQAYSSSDVTPFGLVFHEESEHLLSRDCRESVEEIVDGLPSFQILDECLHRHPRPTKYGCAAKNVRSRSTEG